MKFEKRMWLATPTMHGDEMNYIREAFDTNWVTTEGENLVAIERQISEKLGCKYAVSLTNGTAALHLAVKLAGVKEGVAFSYIMALTVASKVISEQNTLCPANVPLPVSGFPYTCSPTSTLPSN